MSEIMLIPLVIIGVCAIIHLLQNYISYIMIGIFAIAILFNVGELLQKRIQLTTAPNLVGIVALVAVTVMFLLPKKNGEK